MKILIDQILEKAGKRADSAEVFSTRSETVSCGWAANHLKIAEGSETSGIALRVLLNGKVGFFATNKLDDPDKIVDSAMEFAALGTPFVGEFPKSFNPAHVNTYDEKTAKVDAPALIESGSGMISKVAEAKKDALFDAKLDRTVVSSSVANSNGAHAEFRKSYFTGYVHGAVAREGDVLGIWEFGAHNKFENQPDEWSDEIIEKFKLAENIIRLPSGQYKCIMLPMAMDILGPLRSGMNARAVLNHMSPFKDKVGEKIFDDRIFFFDDGLNPEMVGTQPVDDEGVTSQRTTLVEAGVLKGFIHDLHTAKKMGAAPTGNGRKSGLGTAPRAGFTTLTMNPGMKTLDELIAGIDKGVVIDQIMGAHQASPFSGEFSVSVALGFVIENGKIAGRFKDGMLAGNIFKMLKDQVIEIGKDMIVKQSDLLIPPILFDGMVISTPG